MNKIERPRFLSHVYISAEFRTGQDASDHVTELAGRHRHKLQRGRPQEIVENDTRVQVCVSIVP